VTSFCTFGAVAAGVCGVGCVVVVASVTFVGSLATVFSTAFVCVITFVLQYPNLPIIGYT